MKKTAVMFITILIFGLLLVACKPSNINPVGPTTIFIPSTPIPTTTMPPTTAVVPSSTTLPAVTPTTSPTVPATTAPPPPTTPPVDPEVATFTGLFRNISMSDGLTRNPYNYALGQEYTSPMELNLREFFGNGFVGEKTATEAELTELKQYVDSIWVENADFFRLPKDKMEADLQKCFGISLAELPEESFNGLTYLESTNCYYFFATSVHGIAQGVEIRDVEYLADGVVKVTYTQQTWQIEEYVVTLKHDGEGYGVLSNLKVE